MNLEILLLNTLTITALKVQTVINKFLIDKPYTSIFCFTETKVDCINFIPVGLKIITKQRKKKEKKGGGLAIGYINDGKTKLEEIKVDHSDILVVEGTTQGNKIRIILTYMGCSKNKKGKEYEENRNIQRKIEKYFEVDPDVALVCLGDMNGRIKSIEPQIDTDSNGKMVEEWTEKFNLHHLNLSEKCIGKYTFHNNTGKKSVINHVLINGTMMEGF